MRFIQFHLFWEDNVAINICYIGTYLVAEQSLQRNFPEHRKLVHRMELDNRNQY